MRAERLMTNPVATCHPDDSLDRAARLMNDLDDDTIPVVSASGALIGMITDRDIAMSAYVQGRPLREIRVSIAMAAVVFSVSSRATVEEVEALMRSKKVYRVPVVDDDRQLVGVLSLDDVANYAGEGGASMDRKIVATLASFAPSRDRVLVKREPPAARARA